VTDLTPEEMDKARIAEALRRSIITTPVKGPLAHLCDVFNEGWTPPPKVDPDLLAAREWMSDLIENSGQVAIAAQVRAGQEDDGPEIEAFLAGIKHGRANS
jgi:hypothetical protein